MLNRWGLVAMVIGLACGAAQVQAAQLTVAVAANFLGTAEDIGEAFDAETGNETVLVSGSSGKLAAQIRAGAPYDVFLSADQARAAALVDDGKAEAASRFTYAVGRLVLWSRDATLLKGGGEQVLKTGTFRHIAMANPALAPYGRAGQETLDALGVEARLKDRVVLGENVAQAFGLVAKGGVELGFVALSQVANGEWRDTGSRWVVPETLYQPIEQDGVIVSATANRAAAEAFVAYLKGSKAATLIEASGYGVPDRAGQ